MGKGKGAPISGSAFVRPGGCVERKRDREGRAREAMRLAAAKLPIMTRFATRFAQEKML